MPSDVSNSHFCSFFVFFAHLHSQYGSMADWSLLISGTINVSWVNGCCQGICGDSMCVDKRDIAVDAFSSTVKYGMSIDFPPSAYDLNFNPNRWGVYILNRIYWYIGSLGNLEVLEISRITMGWWYNSH